MISPNNQYKPMLITNNPSCAEHFDKKCICVFDNQWSYGEVLEKVREKIYKGYCLLTHPMAGSMKPNQTPYKSVLLAAHSSFEGDFNSLEVIERAIDAYNKFQKQRPTPNWSEKIKKDFGAIDVSLIQGAFERTGFRIL